MRSLFLAAWIGAALLAACSPSTGAAPKAAADMAQGACPDDGARLPVTHLCLGRVANYLEPARLAPGMALEGPAAHCSWTFNETAVGDGSEAILYRAMTCDGVTTTLEYAGGAHSASLSYAASALGNEAGREVVRLFVSDPADPQAVIRYMINGLPRAERRKCEVRPAGIDGWPSDALVIAYNAQAAAALPQDQPNAVCGEYGLNEDEAAFWLVRDGYAYFFQLGQDGLDFDPNSVTLFKRAADGSWAPGSAS
ncbi:MAG: hypothetical protein AB7L65_04250 [Hyphomonadaceae bacterium]